MADKLQKIRKGVEKLKSQLLRGACSSQIAMETRCKEEAYNEVLAILDTMKEEPVSEDLEEAISTIKLLTSNTALLTFEHGFRKGAKWQKAKIMASAIDGEVLENYDGKVLEYDDLILDEKLSNCKVFDKVKIIVIKEG